MKLARRPGARRSQGLYLSVSARKRPSCTTGDGGACSGSPGSRLSWTKVSCCLDWGSSSLLDSSDLSGTSSVSTSANPSDWGELRQGKDAHLGHPQTPGRGRKALDAQPFLHAPVKPNPPLTTPPTGPRCARHAPNGVTPWPRAGKLRSRVYLGPAQPGLPAQLY